MTHFHILAGAEDFHARPVVHRIAVADLKDVLARGIDDFRAMPSHAAFLCLIYPLLGLLLCWLTFGFALHSLLYPLIFGFALLGPFAALVLYELSRERERGLPVSASSAFAVFSSPSFGAIAALGLLLSVIFRHLAGGSAGDLRCKLRRRADRIDRRVCGAGLHHPGGLATHRRRERSRLLVRAPGVGHQRGLVSASARSRRRGRGGGRDLGAGRMD